MSRHRRQQRRRMRRHWPELTDMDLDSMGEKWHLAYGASEPKPTPNAVATADALFGALGFRRVEE